MSEYLSKKAVLEWLKEQQKRQEEKRDRLEIDHPYWEYHEGAADYLSLAVEEFESGAFDANTSEIQRLRAALIKGYSIEGSYPKWGRGLFKVLLQDGNYYGEIVISAGGNVQGVSLISIVANYLEDVDVDFIDMNIPENRKHAVVDNDGYLIGFKLFDDKGNELFIDGDYDKDYFRHVIVGIVMTNYELEKRN